MKPNEGAEKKPAANEHVKITLAFEPASTKDLGDGVLEAVITTSATDRHGEHIETGGISTEQYMNNPVVLYGHDYEGLPIGKTIKLTPFKNKLKARFQLAIEELPFAATVYNLVKNGYLNAVSIGGLVKEWDDKYTTIKEMEMIEFSIVPIPANPQALITARSFEAAAGKSLEVVREEFQSLQHKSLVDKLSEMPENDINSAVSILEMLTATLKAAAKATASESGNPEIKRIKKITLKKTAVAVNQQSEKVIRIIKLKGKEPNNE